MNSKKEKNVKEEEKKKFKKPYAKPELIRNGTIEELTFGGTAAPGDGLSGNGSN